MAAEGSSEGVAPRTNTKRWLRKVPDWAVGAGALAVAMLVIFVVSGLWFRYVSSADSIEGFAVLGDEVVLVDRVNGGEESLIDGVRLFVIDGATGRVRRRSSVGVNRSLVTISSGTLWMRIYEGGFEAYDARTLERRTSEKELFARIPELRALAGERRSDGCHDVLADQWRFTTDSGRFVAFRFSDATIVDVSSRDCTTRGTAQVERGALGDGREVTFSRSPGTAREQLVVKSPRSTQRPVGELTYLEGTFLRGEAGTDPPLLLRAGNDDVFVVRRTGTSSASATEVGRVSLASNTERWSTRIADGQTRVERVALDGGRIYLQEHARFRVLDVESGAVRWQHGD